MEKTMKRTLEFRMSKKVAELTQVVHMLFTRNHEKEVEIDAIKDAYENEITRVIEDANSRLVKVEGRCEELERKLEREKAKQADIVKEFVAKESTSIEEEWKRKLTASEKALSDEKIETQHLRDLLINAQKDIEKLRQRVQEQLNSKSDELRNREAEIAALKKQIAELEKLVRSKQLGDNDTLKKLEKQNEKLEQECVNLQDLLGETYKEKETLMLRVKQLDSEIRALKKDFHRKVSDAVHQNHVVRTPRSAPDQQKYTTYNDELEKLRAEVRKYRLELQNRDANFNRVFKDQQPLIVDPRAGMIGVNSSQVLNTRHSANASHTQVSPLAIQGRDRSFSYDIVQGSYEEAKRPSSRQSISSASSAKLPTLSADQRARLTKLMKPRPLPKELLYSK